MGRLFPRALGAFLALFWIAAPGSASTIEWSELPPLPEAISGHFVGIHNGAIIAAGGSSFPVSPAEGGTKQWHVGVYVLPPNADAWMPAAPLQSPLAYGAAASTSDGVVCAGGSDGQRHVAEAFLLRWESGALVTSALPDLPEPVAYSGGAALGSVVYVVGGQSSADASNALRRMWSIDLADANAGWRTYDDPWEGPARILPVVASQSNALFVFSGADLTADEGGQVRRTYLSDAYRFDPASGWTAVANPPRPIVAAPASSLGIAHIAVFSGDDGALTEQVQALGDAHPGFARDTLLYHTITDAWAVAAEAPHALVTTGVVARDGAIIVVGGEDRPGHRSNAVIAARFLTARSTLGGLDYAVIAIYSVVLIGMGLYFMRRETGTESFFLGNRRVPWWAVGISIFGTSLSAITYLSIPATAYSANWLTFTYNITICFIAPVVVLCFVPYYRQVRITTAYEYLENRFGLLLRIYGSIVFTVFQFGRVSIILCLPAIALATTTGIHIQTCILLMGVIAIVYTVLGGIEAVIWSDVMQAVVLSVGAIVAAVIIGANVEGGIPAAMTAGWDAGKLHAFDWTWEVTPAAIWVLVIGGMFTNLYPSVADQTVVQRYLSTATTRDANKAVWTNALLAIPVSILFFGLGTGLWAFYRQHPEQMEPLGQNDAILPLFIAQHFPPGIAGLIIAGVFAASMSSLDSSMNSFGTVAVNDYYRRFRPNISDKHALLVARVFTLLFGVAGTLSALVIAAQEMATMFQSFIGLLGLVGGGLVGLVALGMWTERAHARGALCGVLVSGAVVYYVSTRTGVPSMLHALIGVTVCFVVGYGASLVLPKPAR